MYEDCCYEFPYSETAGVIELLLFNCSVYLSFSNWKYMYENIHQNIAELQLRVRKVNTCQKIAKLSSSFILAPRLMTLERS